MTHNVFGIIGWKNSGKTTLTERLVVELSRLEDLDRQACAS
jgi:molybdopterin-guanine dinucleotide biosynthesis protein B